MIRINEKSNYISDKWCESPIEKQFLHEIVKYLELGVELWLQLPFQTSIGNFRVDFLIKKGNTEYVIELDGKGYHSEKKDIWRDSFLLGEKRVKAIVRFKAKDIAHNLYECLYFLSQIFPTTFSERGKTNLTTLLEIENKESVDMNIKDNIFKCINKFSFSKIEYNEGEKIYHSDIVITLMDNIEFIAWKDNYDFAISNSIFDVERLIAEYSKI